MWVWSNTNLRNLTRILRVSWMQCFASFQMRAAPCAAPLNVSKRFTTSNALVQISCFSRILTSWWWPFHTNGESILCCTIPPSAFESRWKEMLQCVLHCNMRRNRCRMHLGWMVCSWQGNSCGCWKSVCCLPRWWVLYEMTQIYFCLCSWCCGAKIAKILGWVQSHHAGLGRGHQDAPDNESQTSRHS